MRHPEVLRMYPASEPVGGGVIPLAATGSRGLNGKSIVMTQDASKQVTPKSFQK